MSKAWMSRVWLGALALSLFPALGFSAGVPSEGTVLGEIQALLDAQAKAWSAGELEDFCSVYADDTVFISPTGLTKGRQAVLERYRKRYPDKQAMGTLSLEILEVRVPGGEADASTLLSASAVGRWTLSYPDRDDATGLTLLVFHRQEGGDWLIVQDASM